MVGLWLLEIRVLYDLVSLNRRNRSFLIYMQTKNFRVEFLILSVLVLVIGFGLNIIVPFRQAPYFTGDNIAGRL